MTITDTVQTFHLPDLGEGLNEAEIVRWLVTEGDTVEIDQPVVEVETAKAIVDMPCPFAGRVAQRHGAEGATVAVGSPLLSVAAAQDGQNTAAGETGSGNVLTGYGTTARSSSGRRRRPRATPAPRPRVATTGRRQAPGVTSPLVRRLARENGVDVATLDGSGVGGVVTRADVQHAIDTHAGPAVASSAAAPPGAGERRTPLSGFRKAASARLARSRSEIPEATVWVDVDATALCDLRDNLRAAADPGPGLLAYLARFTVAALREHPVLNAHFDAERQEIVEYDAINLGVAVQSERGLVVPAVRDAHTLSAARLDTEIRRLTARAREGTATSEELSAGTFTLNNYGRFNVDGSAAIINYPQVAILGFGRIIDRPWAVDGELRIRKIMQMSLVFDHRVCDGGTAAGFMRRVADVIEHPAAAVATL